MVVWMDCFKSEIKYFTLSIELINTALLCNYQIITAGLNTNFFLFLLLFLINYKGLSVIHKQKLKVPK